MINQGEEIKFVGTFEQKVGENWTKITSLSDYTIDALVLNEATNNKIIFSSSGASPTITKDNTKGTYTFTISSKQSASLIGECTIEVSIKNSQGSPIITDNKGKFVINESLLGRTLSK